MVSNDIRTKSKLLNIFHQNTQIFHLSSLIALPYHWDFLEAFPYPDQSPLIPKPPFLWLRNQFKSEMLVFASQTGKGQRV